MGEKNSGINWDNIIKGGLLLVALLAGGFALFKSLETDKEREKRIDAQNELARNAEVVREKEQLWSKLSMQREDVIEELRRRNADLATTIEERDQRVLAMAETIAKIRPIRIVVERDNVSQEEPEPGRLRVNFDQSLDPIRVQGFTLTNPAEAELEVSFTRPLRLRTTITQQPNGQWVTYFDSDWANLEIEQMETIVNPLDSIVDRPWYERIIVGGSIGVNLDFNAVNANLHLLADFDSFAVGPMVGVGVLPEDNALFLGLVLQTRPF